MKKSDLKTGHIVELRNGRMLVVLSDVCEDSPDSDNTEGACTDIEDIQPCRYTEDMKHTNNKNHDIVAVYQPYHVSDILQFKNKIVNCKEIWRRPEPVKKTIAELVADYEAAHGCDVEVVEPGYHIKEDCV